MYIIIIINSNLERYLNFRKQEYYKSNFYLHYFINKKT